jgi:ribokinase
LQIESSVNRPIVVAGSINLDLVSIGRRIPAPGETVKGDTFHTFHGGKGANQAVAAARLRYPVSMIGKVGGDDFGRRLKQGLRAEKINVRGVSTAASSASGVAMIAVDAKGQNSIMVVPGANDELLPRDLEKCLPQLRTAGIILTQLEIPMESVEYLGSIAQRYGIPLMLDPAPARSIPRSLLRRVTYLTPNETETCALCGISPAELSPATVARYAQYLQGGASNIIVKMGRFGAYVAAADGLRRLVMAFKVKAVDSTAAGDAFNAGLAVALMRGMDLAQAVRFAAAVGALSTTHPGAQASMPQGCDVEQFLGNQAARPRRPRAVAGKWAVPSANFPAGSRNEISMPR